MLCGGQSMMLAPSEKPSIDMGYATEILKDSVLRSSEDMIEFMYNDVKLTLYPNGSIMFYYFTDLEVASAYATEVTSLVTKKSD